MTQKGTGGTKPASRPDPLSIDQTRAEIVDRQDWPTCNGIWSADRIWPLPGTSAASFPAAPAGLGRSPLGVGTLFRVSASMARRVLGSGSSPSRTQTHEQQSQVPWERSKEALADSDGSGGCRERRRAGSSGSRPRTEPRLYGSESHCRFRTSPGLSGRALPQGSRRRGCWRERSRLHVRALHGCGHNAGWRQVQHLSGIAGYVAR